VRHTIRNRSNRDPRREEQASALRAVTALAAYDDGELSRIYDLGTEVRRAAGSVLQRPGAMLRQAFVVLDGVITEQPTVGRESVAGAGHGVGFESLGGHVAQASSKVVAMTDVRVLVFGPIELADIAAVDGSRQTTPVGSIARRRALHRAPAPTWAASQSAIA